MIQLLGADVGNLDGRLDPWMRVLQLLELIGIAGTVATLWNVYESTQSQPRRPLLSIVWIVLVALAAAYLVWLMLTLQHADPVAQLSDDRAGAAASRRPVPAASTPADTVRSSARGLTVLFLTQMWAEFSYFGLQAMLVYYMTDQLGFSQARSSLIYGAYGAAAFFSPFFGGIIADRWLGRTRKASCWAAR